MGACFVEQTFPKSDDAALKDAYINMRENLRSEYGSSPYSGTFATNNGLRILPSRYASQAEAYDALENITEKRGPALAVKVGVAPILTDTEKEKINALTTQHHHALRAVSEIKREDTVALAAIKSAKSVRISCQDCTSSIARSFLKHTNCPVCGADALRSKTQKTAHGRRIAKAEADFAKIDAAITKIRNGAKKRIKPDDWQWYVCALAGS
jgi:hypothetical protein